MPGTLFITIYYSLQFNSSTPFIPWLNLHAPTTTISSPALTFFGWRYKYSISLHDYNQSAAVCLDILTECYKNYGNLMNCSCDAIWNPSICNMETLEWSKNVPALFTLLPQHILFLLLRISFLKTHIGLNNFSYKALNLIPPPPIF